MFIGITAGAGAKQGQSVDLGSCIGESNQFIPEILIYTQIITQARVKVQSTIATSAAG
jgi:hypothetical protein